MGNVVERITINEETGSVTYNKCDASGRPGNVERVLAIHTPLRLEFYERSANSGLRVDWKAPISVAREAFSNIVQLAKKIESSSSDVVGYGLASKTITDLSQDTLWKAMLYAMRNPAQCGLKVDGVSVRDMTGYMQRTMRTLEKPGSPTVTDNIRVMESAQEITYRPVENNVESERSGSSHSARTLCGLRCSNATPRTRCVWIGKLRVPFAFQSSTQRSRRPSVCDAHVAYRQGNC